MICKHGDSTNPDGALCNLVKGCLHLLPHGPRNTTGAGSSLSLAINDGVQGAVRLGEQAAIAEGPATDIILRAVCWHPYDAFGVTLKRCCKWAPNSGKSAA